MDLDDYIYSVQPKMNEEVCNGLATEQLGAPAEHYFSSVLDSVFKEGFGDLRFVKLTLATPEEFHAALVPKRKNARRFEVAETDLYLVRLHFELAGKPIDKHYTMLILPRRGGMFYLRGAVFQILPIMADKAISVSLKSVFVPLERARLMFYRSPQTFYYEGQRVSEYVVDASVHNVEKGGTIKAKSTMGHYLFCKYGLRETFKRFTGKDVFIGDEAIEKAKADYPESSFKVAESTNVRTGRLGEDRFVIAIKDSEESHLEMGLLASLFYVIGVFPQRVRAEYITGDKYEISLWRVLMGHINYASDDSEGILELNIDGHIASLDNYVDSLSRLSLKQGGVDVNDLYELFAYVIGNFNWLVVSGTQDVSSMYDKKLVVTRYVMSNLKEMAFNMLWAYKRRNRPFTNAQDAIAFIRQSLPTEKIMDVIKGQHPEIRAVSSASDVMLFGNTTTIIQQNDTGEFGESSSSLANLDPSRFTHVSQAEVGGYLNITKAEPTGRSRLNAFVQTDSDHCIVRKPHLQEATDAVQQLIKR